MIGSVEKDQNVIHLDELPILEHSSDSSISDQSHETSEGLGGPEAPVDVILEPVRTTVETPGVQPPPLFKPPALVLQLSPAIINSEGPTDSAIPDIQAPFDPAPYVPWPYFRQNTLESIANIKTPTDEVRLGPSEIDELCDSLHIHPKELPRRLASILNSIGSEINSGDHRLESNGKISVDQRLDSEHQLSEDLYMQMGVEKKMSVPPPVQLSAKLQEALKLGKCLQTAINDGDQEAAVMCAVKLAADSNLLVTIDVKEKVSVPEERELQFRYTHTWAATRPNLSSGFLKKLGSNQSPQLHRLSRNLKSLGMILSENGVQRR